MTNIPMLMNIRMKKIGVLVRDARLACGKNLDECAQAIGVTAQVLQNYEFGEGAITLPELEMLAFYLKVPLEHFWGNELLSRDGKDQKSIDPEQVKGLRQRMIGATLRQSRVEADLPFEEVAARSGIPGERLTQYEMGELPIPLPELEVLAQVLDTPVQAFQDKAGPIGSWFVQQRAVDEFTELSPELQAFVCKPVNRPYLELAQRLSEMSVAKLRGVAESLLEISL